MIKREIWIEKEEEWINDRIAIKVNGREIKWTRIIKEGPSIKRVTLDIYEIMNNKCKKNYYYYYYFVIYVKKKNR